MRFAIAVWCCMCKCSEKPVEHLLLHCLVARDLCHISFIGINWFLRKAVSKFDSGVVALASTGIGKLQNHFPYALVVFGTNEMPGFSKIRKASYRKVIRKAQGDR